jgi:hypothetical protein
MNPSKKCHCQRYRGALRTVVDVRRRCTAYPKLSRSLYTIASDPEKRLSVARCLVCRSMWAEEIVFEDEDDMNCLYAISTEGPARWLEIAEPVVQIIVREDEDRRFFDNLGEEMGPRRCLFSGCTRLRLLEGQFCRRHLFETVHDRPCPW